MKKILTLLLLAACVGCNTEDDTQKNESANFSGTLKVTSVATPTNTPFELSDVHFELAETKDKTFNLTMHQIRFVATMPMSLTIVIPQLRLTDSDNDGILELSSTVDPIVPYFGGKPYTLLQIPEFSGTYAGGKLAVSFVCKSDNPKFNVNGEPLNHKAVFQGTLLK